MNSTIYYIELGVLSNMCFVFLALVSPQLRREIVVAFSGKPASVCLEKLTEKSPK